MLVGKVSNLLDGYIALPKPDPHHEHSTDIGIYWGPCLARTRGATEAFYLFVGHVFDTLGYRRIGWDFSRVSRVCQEQSTEATSGTGSTTCSTTCVLVAVHPNTTSMSV